MEIDRLLKQIDIGEDQDCEFKSADGGFPKDAWKTISAFANTEGGYIILGVSEKQNQLQITGVRNAQKMRKELWDSLNNTQKINRAICKNSDIHIKSIDQYQLLIIFVPEAERNQRPIYINGNPIAGSYKRGYEGDYGCTEEEVQQMLRDASNTPHDSKILDNFDFNDIDQETIRAFRQRFANRDPDHQWLALDDKKLLHQLGGWQRDRNSDAEGLTIAGLLMFGRERSILDAFPHYHLDYQERLSKDPETRWTYRLTLDGKWEGNLFNFYYRVYTHLVNNLNVPFQLDKDAVRKEETHVHEAIREALVNTLIHADHRSTRPITIVKQFDCYLFSNPGRLRIPLQRLYEGGLSDPRNPNLQKMFQMIGLGEKAGSGFGKILRAWQEQQWLIPFVSEKLDTEITSVFLPMTSLIPEEVEADLKKLVGDVYWQLTELDRIVLVLAHKFDEISNIDIQRYRQEHSRDIGECLKKLVQKGCLRPSGKGKGTRYSLSNRNQSQQLSLSIDSEHKDLNSEHKDSNSEHSQLNSEHKKKLIEIAKSVREKRRVNPKQMRDVILKICSEHYLSLRTLAELLNREPDSIRNHYVNPMIDEGLLQLRYPEQINHPQQAYKTISPSE